ncbi:hypothetical protein [Pseudomonas sp. BW7P1]|uniref:hypothetical protein n=1 Tax=Pseudomonas TaxID=286 RepID=UPI0021ADC4BB|nr:hypothetical protein [Pseudomonas sp. BW7P1]UWI59527.1 hypothetical protein NWV16_15545 [Pseudomonas sp. BW7P1]
MLVGAIAYSAYQLKLISVILDNLPGIVENEEFLRNYAVQIKINKFLEKIWPRVKRARLSGVSSGIYKVVNFLFLFLLLIQFFFSDFLSFAAPAMFLSLGFLAAIGNALQDKRRSVEVSKKVSMPFSILFPLFIAYHIDTSEKLLNMKAVFSAQVIGYEATLASMVVGLGLFCYFGLSILDRFQRVIVIWLLNRALILSKNMVLVGINPTMPGEKEMRAIAKEAIVVTAKNMAIFGVVVGVLVAFVRRIME